VAPARAAFGLLAVFAVALAMAATLHREPASPAQLSGDRAARAALDDASVRKYLAETGFTRERVTPIDDRLVRVSFFDGPRIVLDAGVSPSGGVTNPIFYPPAPRAG